MVRGEGKRRQKNRSKEKRKREERRIEVTGRKERGQVQRKMEMVVRRVKTRREERRG